MENLYAINTTHFQSSLFKCKDLSLYMFREQNVQIGQTYTDVNGPLDLIALVEPSSRLRLSSAKHNILNEELPFGVYLPKFSILNWVSLSGHLRWHAFTFQGVDAQLFDECQKPTLFSWNGSEIPEDILSLSRLFKFSDEKITIKNYETINPLVIKAKKIIDVSYKNYSSLTQISEQLKCSDSYLSREFKKYLKISMVEYRTRVRLFDVLVHVNNGESLTHACLNSGFGSISQFNVQFKKYLNFDPSYFTGRRKKMMKPC